MRNHNYVLVENPFPNHIAFNEGRYNTSMYPQYSVWGEIKLDSRYLKTPERVIHIMNKLDDAIIAYKTNYSELSKNVEEQISHILKDEIGAERNFEGFVQSRLQELIEGDFDKLVEYFTFTAGYSDLSDKEKEQLHRRILRKIQDNPSFVKLMQIKAVWEETEQNAIDYLSHLIRKSTVKFKK